MNNCNEKVYERLKRQLSLRDSCVLSCFAVWLMRHCGICRNHECTEKIKSVTSMVLPPLSQLREVIGTPTGLLGNQRDDQGYFLKLSEDSVTFVLKGRAEEIRKRT